MSRRVADLAYARSGDKGDVLNVALMAKDAAAYQVLLRHCTAEAVKAHYREWAPGEVVRYELPKVESLNFVLRGVLEGGLSRNLRIDALGKAMGLALLRMELPGQ